MKKGPHVDPTNRNIAAPDYIRIPASIVFPWGGQNVASTMPQDHLDAYNRAHGLSHDDIAQIMALVLSHVESSVTEDEKMIPAAQNVRMTSKKICQLAKQNKGPSLYSKIADVVF